MSRATLSDSRLSPNRIVSIASGMPWPRILSDPKRAISPTIRLPITGIATTMRPTCASVMTVLSAESRPNQNRLVAIAISLTSTHAPNAPPLPTTIAIIASMTMRRSTL